MTTNLPLATWFIDAGSDNATRVDILFYALLAFSVVVTSILCFLILFYISRYRVGAVVDRTNQTHQPRRLELTWIGIFTAISLVLFGWAAWLYADIERPPTDATAFYIVGKQWMWKAYQPSGREEINALHVPAGRPIKLVMTSQDVIHSFFLPTLRQKQDVLPQRYTTLWFNATVPGTYPLYCSEYCGTDHSKMKGTLVVMTPADYAQWLGGEPSGVDTVNGTPGTPIAPMAQRLQKTFNSAGCVACHVPNSSVRAPRLDGIYGRPVRLANDQTIVADDAYIRESILYPNAKISAGYPQPSLMPPYKGQLTEAQLRDLVEFIKSIRDGWPTGAAAGPPASERAADSDAAPGDPTEDGPSSSGSSSDRASSGRTTSDRASLNRESLNRASSGRANANGATTREVTR